jgi:sugar phosphate isomerase/epimerase
VLVSHTSELFSVKEDRRSRLDICRKNILEVVAFCEQSGTRLALETIWNFTEQTGEESSLGETEEEFLEIVNFSDSECLGIHIDTGHSHLLGNLMRIVELAGDRLFSLHIHDNHGQREGGHWDEHLIPGEGDIDWERLLSTLASVNYNGALVVEVPPKGPVESRLEEIQRWMQWVQQRSTQS